MAKLSITPINRVEYKTVWAVTIFFGLLAAMSFGILGWHSHRQWVEYQTGLKITAMIVKRESCGRGGPHADIVYPYEVEGKHILCRTRVVLPNCNYEVGQLVLIVPQSNSCFDVAGPY